MAGRESVWGSEAAKHRANFRRQREDCRRYLRQGFYRKFKQRKDQCQTNLMSIVLLCVIS